MSLVGGCGSAGCGGPVDGGDKGGRWWFPRSTDLAGVDPAHANPVATIVNVYADASSTTRAPPPSSCSDHWDWPSAVSVSCAVLPAISMPFELFE